MSSSEQSSSCESDESIPDLQKLQPYDLEPEFSSSELSTTSSNDEQVSGSDSDSNEESRIGNTNWCLCGKCLPMCTYTESFCCLDTNEVPDEYFEGNFRIFSNEINAKFTALLCAIFFLQRKINATIFDTGFQKNKSLLTGVFCCNLFQGRCSAS